LSETTYVGGPSLARPGYPLPGARGTAWTRAPGGRADDNDVVVKGHLISRLRARIDISRNTFVLIDQSTNGTFVQTADGEELFARHDTLKLKGQGLIGLGRLPEQGSPHTILFSCEEV
jgi:adenylate cyclase